MKVEIHYCAICDGFDVEAKQLAAFLESKGYEAETFPGENGQYDVIAGGRRVYSADRTGRFPKNEDVLAAISG
jgi:selT/selW/selH-like putative selenoprotein